MCVYVSFYVPLFLKLWYCSGGHKVSHGKISHLSLSSRGQSGVIFAHFSVSLIFTLFYFLETVKSSHIKFCTDVLGINMAITSLKIFFTECAPCWQPFSGMSDSFLNYRASVSMLLYVCANMSICIKINLSLFIYFQSYGNVHYCSCVTKW